jgi:hypothetical protein
MMSSVNNVKNKLQHLRHSEIDSEYNEGSQSLQRCRIKFGMTFRFFEITFN